MALFVHLAPAKHVRAIRRAGIRCARPAGLPPEAPWGVFAVPVTPDFVATHQWLRELRRCRRQRTFLAVYFRLPDDEPVWFGHYARAPERTTAAQAVAAMSAATPALGYQAIVPRPVAPREIHAVRALPHALGWRYFPGAHGRKPCPYPCCLARGEYGARKLRQRLADG
jgi:hypothetical protein